MYAVPKRIIAEIRRKHIDYVRFVWCDNSGVIGAKAVHTRFLQRDNPDVVGFPKPHTIPGNVQVASGDASSYFGFGDVTLRPDWSSFTCVPYAPGHAKVFCYLYENTKPWAHCTRTFLQTMIRRAAHYGLTFQAVFENEFYLLKRVAGRIEAFDSSVFGQTFPIDAGSTIFSEITQALTAQDVYPTVLHAESGKGQFELAVRHQDALRAADQQITFRETVRAIVQRHEGLCVSFLPKIFPDQAGSGSHIHISLWEKNTNITGDKIKRQMLSKAAREFTAGILSHLGSLVCITAPTTNSYRRLLPSVWSSAYSCWGYDNRETALRIPQNGGSVTNIEYKPADATCNPYIAIGAIIAAGLDGIKNHMELSSALDSDPENLSEKHRKSLHIYRLPASLGDAIKNLKNNTVLREQIGDDLFDSFIAVREAEWIYTKKWSIEKEVLELQERY